MTSETTLPGTKSIDYESHVDFPRIIWALSIRPASDLPFTPTSLANWTPKSRRHFQGSNRDCNLGYGRWVMRTVEYLNTA